MMSSPSFLAIIAMLLGLITGSPTVALPVEDGAHAPAASASQRPGTVRLPEGGTANLVRSELNLDGSLPVPERLDEATWWGAELGAARGVALLSGHVDWGGRTGPFAELWRHRPGQLVTVVDASGGTWTYRITGVRALRKADLPRHAGTLFSQDGAHRLVLITCGGQYVGGEEIYRDYRVVTATLHSRPR